jgi:hypothetical protein
MQVIDTGPQVLFGGARPSELKTSTTHTPEKQELLNIVRKTVQESILDIRNNHLAQWERNHRAYERTWAPQDVTRKSERSKYVSSITQQAVNDTVAATSDALFGQGRWFTLEDNSADKDKLDIEQASITLDEELRGNQAQEAWESLGLLGEMYGTGIMEIQPVKLREYIPTTRDDGSYGVEIRDKVGIRYIPTRPHDFRIAPGATDIPSAPWCATERYEPITTFTSLVDNQTWENNYIDPFGHTFQADDLTSGDLTYQHRPGYVLITNWHGLVPSKLVDPQSREQFLKANVVIINRSMVAYVGPNPFMCKFAPFVDYRPIKVPGRFFALGAAHVVHQDQVTMDRHYRTHEDALAFTAYPMTGMDASRVPKGLRLTAEPGKNLMVNGRPSEIIEQISLGTPSTVSLETAQRLYDWSKQASGMPGGGSAMSTMQGVKTGVSEMASMPIAQSIKRRVRSFQNGTLVPALTMITKLFMQYDPERFPATDFTFKVEGALSMLEKGYERAELSTIIQSMTDDNPVKPALIAQLVTLTNHPNRHALAQGLMQISQERANNEAQDTQAIVMKEIALRKEAATASKMEAEAEEHEAKAIYHRAKAGSVQMEIQADVLKSMVLNSSAQKDDSTEFAQRLEAMNLVLKEMAINEKRLDRESNERIAAIQTKSKAPRPADDELLSELDSILGEANNG